VYYLQSVKKYISKHFKTTAMKIMRFFNLFFLAAALCLAGCSKTGPAGPQGPQGEKGEQGDQGLQGIPGADGSTIYSDNGKPVADIGKSGDYYLDKNTGDLYGPKTDNGWGNPVNLKGSKGDKGATGATGPQGTKGEKGDPGQGGKDGSQMLNGTSAPASSTGNIGDYYWNKANFAMYGPKTKDGWGTGIILRGPKGEKGDPGTANVIYSDWIQFSMTGSGSGYGPGTGSGYGAENQYYYINMQILDKHITQDVIDHGVVLAYCKLDAMLYPASPGNPLIYITPLPTPISLGDPTIKGRLVLKYRMGSVYFFLEKTGGVFTDYPPIQIRYVIIPGGVHTRRSSPPPDPQNYKATCEYYGIPE
jgi:hypothetical protein